MLMTPHFANMHFMVFLRYGILLKFTTPFPPPPWFGEFCKDLHLVYNLCILLDGEVFEFSIVSLDNKHLYFEAQSAEVSQSALVTRSFIYIFFFFLYEFITSF